MNKLQRYMELKSAKILTSTGIKENLPQIAWLNALKEHFREGVFNSNHSYNEIKFRIINKGPHYTVITLKNEDFHFNSPKPSRSKMKNEKLFLGDMLISIETKKNIPIDHIFESIAKHQKGDWGSVDKDHAHANNCDAESNEGYEVSSLYKYQDQEYWIITAL